MPQVHVNPTPEELRRFTEEMPQTRVSEFGNTNTHTKVLSRSAGSTYVVGGPSSGKTMTRNEKNGFREIAIWKDGVTL